MKYTIISLAAMAILSLAPAAFSADGISPDIVSYTRLSNGLFIVQCKNMQVRSNLRYVDLRDPGVCAKPNGTPPNFVSLTDVRTSGACILRRLNMHDAYQFSFGRDSYQVAKGTSDRRLSCRLYLDHQLPKGYRLSYQKLKLDFSQSNLGSDSRVEFAALANGSQEKTVMLPEISEDHSMELSFDERAYTDCGHIQGGNIGSALMMAYRPEQLSDSDVVRMSKLTILDMEIEKCEP